MACAPISDSVFGAVNNMGIGKLGDADTILKRKFRFVFGITTECGVRVPPHFVKTAGRPDFTIEDTELNFLNETIWIPGKGKWETITVTYYDAAGPQSSELLKYLRGVYDFADDCRFMNSKPSEYAGTGTLVMLDGNGYPLERWRLRNMWPTSVKFGELDYSSSDVAEIELTLRYSQVQHFSLCGGDSTPCPGTPC